MTAVETLMQAEIDRLCAELEEWRFTNRVDELDRHVTRLAEHVRVLREVVESAAAADEYYNSPGAIQRLALMARAALEKTKCLD